jgi:predicted aconitase with swiveling domain
MPGRGLRVISFKGRGIVKGFFHGEALVAREPISFLGGVDPSTGTVVERGHELKGKTLAGKALIMPHGKGSTVGSYVLYSLAKKGLAPKAIATVKTDLMTLTGCVISGIPLLSEVPREVLGVVKNGDVVEIDARGGVLRVFLKKK